MRLQALLITGLVIVGVIAIANRIPFARRILGT